MAHPSDSHTSAHDEPIKSIENVKESVSQGFAPNIPSCLDGIPLLTRAEAYKPFRYPWAFEYWERQQAVHWLPSEVPMADDVRDWNQALTDNERALLTQILRFFTQGDVEVNDCYMGRYAQVFGPTEIRMMLSAFSNTETIHIAAYSHLLDTIGMPEIEYSAFLEYKEMRDKVDHMRGFGVGTPFEIARTLAAFAAFTEGLQLFASFAMLKNFPRFNKMKGVGQIVTWSMRDESLHAEAGIRLFRQFIIEAGLATGDGRPNADLAAVLTKDCQDVIEHEDAFIRLAFAMGPVEGMTENDLHGYIRHVADHRLEQLGCAPIYDTAGKPHPLPWMAEEAALMEHANFFETQATAYSRGVTAGSWADADTALDRFFGKADAADQETGGKAGGATS